MDDRILAAIIYSIAVFYLCKWFYDVIKKYIWSNRNFDSCFPEIANFTLIQKKFYYACWYGELDAAISLVKKGAVIDGYALAIACHSYQKNILSWLLENKCPINDNSWLLFSQDRYFQCYKLDNAKALSFLIQNIKHNDRVSDILYLMTKISNSDEASMKIVANAITNYLADTMIAHLE